MDFKRWFDSTNRILASMGKDTMDILTATSAWNAAIGSAAHAIDGAGEDDLIYREVVLNLMQREFPVAEEPETPFPKRDPLASDEEQGLYHKYIVRRVDGTDRPGGKHHNCRYFVIDLDHDEHAAAAMRAYAAACGRTHPKLAGDINVLFGVGSPGDNIASAVRTLVWSCHGAARKAGWWVDGKGESITHNPYCFSNKLMLTVSELSEAMEGDRKGLMDDKLPHRPMREVELADAVIRICDLAGAYSLDLPGALVEKLRYNAQREDHKPENRAKDGGKKY